jgi:hypothetical protein
MIPMQRLNALAALRTKRTQIPEGYKLPVLLGAKEVSDIRERTFVSSGLLIGGIVQPNGSLRFDRSLGDIEEIHGHVAASANHTDDPKLEKRLDRIYSKLQHFPRLLQLSSHRHIGVTSPSVSACSHRKIVQHCLGPLQ